MVRRGVVWTMGLAAVLCVLAAQALADAPAGPTAETYAAPAVILAAPDPSVTMQPVQRTTCPVIAATQCPAVATVCPGDETKCPPKLTKCLNGPTYCPTVATKCPAPQTKCPLYESKCPVGPTQCPARETHCPVHETKCPATETKCTAGETRCPIEETKCPAVESKCGADVSLTFVVKTPDDAAAAGATVIGWQPPVPRSATSQTDAGGRATLGPFLSGKGPQVYATSADRKFAASLTVSAANSKTGPVAVKLQPARAAVVFLEDAGGKRLQGYVSFYMSAGKPAAPKKVEEERDAHLIVSIDIPGDAADKGAEVPGLLPGVKYLVKGSALGYSAVGGDPWTEWSFTQQDASPKLILKFEKR